MGLYRHDLGVFLEEGQHASTDHLSVTMSYLQNFTSICSADAVQLIGNIAALAVNLCIPNKLMQIDAQDQSCIS